MVKAYQVPWDIQDSMFGSEEWYLENVAIFGNKDFNEHICPAVERAKSVLWMTKTFSVLSKTI